jgi:hypothetical protein
MRARIAVLGLLCVLATGTARGQAPVLEGYGTIGEGLTAAAAGGAIEFGWRMFTIYTLDEACRRSHADRVARLRAHMPRIGARVGQPFPPARLTIVALDTANRVLPRVPIVVDLNASPDFFDSHLPDAPDGPSVPLGTGPLVARSVGTATFRARTVCPGSAADVLVEFQASR